MRLHRPQPLKSTPTVTVVVPCYNYGHYLPAAVGSALDQPGVDVDVIVVDDCSTDGSEVVAERLAAQHDQVRLIRNEVNKRHIATYNTGLAEAKGDYVVLLSADDLLAPGSLTRATALFEGHPEVGLVYGYAPSFDQVPPPANAGRSWSTWTGDQWLRRMANRGDNLVTNPEVVLRREIMDAVGGYDPEFPHAGDMLLWMQAAVRYDVGRVNGIQAFYRDHGQNMHHTDYSGTITDMRERLNLFRYFFGPDGEGGGRTDAAPLRAAAERSIAVEALWNACRALDAGRTVGGAEAIDFAAMAEEADPSSARTLLYREFRRRMDGSVPAWQSKGLETAYVLRWKLRWRRWRRWGT